MIVVAVIGILAAVAYPAYTSSILKGKRAQGRTALAELLQQQERYMTQRNCYVAFTNTAANVVSITALSPSTECGGVVATAVPFKTFSGDSLAAAAYTLSADRCPVTGGTLALSECIRVIATPIRADPEAGQLLMTSTGVKSCTGTKQSPATFCWP